jgi:hypothetical protein
MPSTTESDHLSGYATTALGNAYTAYPFEFTFKTETENLRKVIDDVLKAPYVFVVRTITVKNSVPGSPRKEDLDKMAAVPAGNPDPNATNAPASTVGPQYLFGSSTLQVQARIDMIEWMVKSADDATNTMAATPPRPAAHHP